MKASIYIEPSAHPLRTLLWKLGLAALLLLVVLFGLPSTDRALLFLLSATLVVWGATFVGGALWGLLAAPPSLRVAWAALALGAYAALAVPPIWSGDYTRTLEALGPVVALTLAAQLGRHDLAGAVRDWASLLGLALYAALGVVALWSLLPFGPALFSFVVLLPPVISELMLLLLRRASRLSEGARYAAAAMVAAIVVAGAISLTQYNTRMPAGWALFFTAAIALLIGGALILSLATRPLFRTTPGPARALVELTHGALLIGLAVYVPLRLLAI
jgi:hypothetical protein